MITETKLKQSFGIVKEDMRNLFEHIQYLYSEVEQLKVRNMVLMQEIETLRKPKRRVARKTVKKSTKKRSIRKKK